MSDFKFDPNSTKNQGRWRLRDPKDFEKNVDNTRKRIRKVFLIFMVFLKKEVMEHKQLDLTKINGMKIKQKNGGMKINTDLTKIVD